jgi:hypothetical protein
MAAFKSKSQNGTNKKNNAKVLNAPKTKIA